MDAATVAGAVVVGDDGSVDSRRAVEWAAEDAARRGVRLVVVRAWSITSAPRPTGVERGGYVPSEDEFAEAVRAELASDVAPVLERPSDPASVPAEVTFMAAHASAEDALVWASREAAVVVVGARGQGVARWLGSVSGSVVRAAHGPVVVVPGRRERAKD